MAFDTIWHFKATLVVVLLVDDLKNRSICIWPKVENANLQVVHIWTTSLVCFCCILQKFRSVVVSKTVGLFNLCTQPLVRQWICNNVVCKLLRMRSLIPETDAQTHSSQRERTFLQRLDWTPSWLFQCKSTKLSRPPMMTVTFAGEN